MNRSRWLIGLLILGIALAACGGEDEDVKLQAVDNQDDDTAQNEAAALAENFQGSVVFVKGTGLYYYDPASAEGPVFLTDQFDPYTLNQSPSGNVLLYETGDFSDGHAYALDMNTRTIREVPSTFNSRAAETWGVGGWSPDEQWVITFLWPLGIEVVRVDGQASYELSGSTDTGAMWLDDGSLLLIDQDFTGFGGQGEAVYRGVSRMDLTTGQVEEWDVDLDALAQDFDATVEALVAEHGAALAGDQNPAADVFVNAPENFFTFTNTASICDSWTFTAGPVVPDEPEPELLYEAAQTYKITDFQVLDDASWLFLQWVLPNCRISALPVISLVRLTPGQEPQIVTDQIFSETDLSRRRLNLGNTGRFALSTDQQRVVWVGGNAEASTSTINLTDMASGDTQTILVEERGELSPDVFAANQMFRAVFWVGS